MSGLPVAEYFETYSARAGLAIEVTCAYPAKKGDSGLGRYSNGMNYSFVPKEDGWRLTTRHKMDYVSLQDYAILYKDLDPAKLIRQDLPDETCYRSVEEGERIETHSIIGELEGSKAFVPGWVMTENGQKTFYNDLQFRTRFNINAQPRSTGFLCIRQDIEPVRYLVVEKDILLTFPKNTYLVKAGEVIYEDGDKGYSSGSKPEFHQNFLVTRQFYMRPDPRQLASCGTAKRDIKIAHGLKVRRT